MEIKLQEKGQIFYNSLAWKAFMDFIEKQQNANIFLIVDENTEKFCLPYFLKNYPSKIQPNIITIPEGEAHKNISTCLNVWNILSENGADRNSIIINLGGGVVTDLGGFVASTFKRGLRFINIPTSLLAMVDASVGGKNGVDLGYLKNQIGVINSPEMVLLDTAFLNTLPKEHLISGLAEMLKHGLIYSEEYWNRIKEVNFETKTEFEKLISDSVEIKKEIVIKDPFEHNIRKTLNYGHTLGHAIESYFLENESKQTLLHGEAVAIGLILATYISSESLGFPKNKLKEISKAILKYFPKVNFDQNDISEVIKLLIFDKKNRNGEVLFVLLKDIGQHKIDCKVDNTLIYSAFKFYKNF